MKLNLILMFLAFSRILGYNRINIPYKKDIHSFKNFVSDFEKDYKNDFIYKKGFSNFQKNIDFINKHNENSTNSFSLKINNFADEDPKVLKKNLFSFDIETVDREKASDTNDFFFSLKDKNDKNKSPLSLDYRKQNLVTRVKNQGRCGSCWAFSAIGALESKHAIKTGELKEFSEQRLVDCSTSNFACSGGLMHTAFNDLLINDGISLANDYPYVGEKQKCNTNAKNFHDFNFLGYKFVLSHSTKALINALQFNPVCIALAGDPMKFLFYGEGIFDCEECSTKNNHAVLLVGYEMKDDIPYWIVKNSWGTKWGEDGYIRIKMIEGDGILGMNQYGLYPY